MIDDSSTTKLVESDYSDLFCDRSSPNNASNIFNNLSIITLFDSLRNHQDEKDDDPEDLSLLKWEKKAHSTNDIIGDVKIGVKTRCQL